MPQSIKAHNLLLPLDNQKSTAEERKGCTIIYHTFIKNALFYL